jgi:hypothetical protein
MRRLLAISAVKITISHNQSNYIGRLVSKESGEYVYLNKDEMENIHGSRNHHQSRPQGHKESSQKAWFLRCQAVLQLKLEKKILIG